MSLSVCLTVCLSLSINLPVFTWLSVCLYLFVCYSACLSVCLSKFEADSSVEDRLLIPRTESRLCCRFFPKKTWRPLVEHRSSFPAPSLPPSLSLLLFLLDELLVFLLHYHFL